MSRSGYSDYCENVQLWRGAVDRALLGSRGQAFLKRLRAALDAMPVKRLITNEFVDHRGDVCALGSIDPRCPADPDDREGVAQFFGIAPAMAAEIVYVNDEGTLIGPEETPEQRWHRVRWWVGQQIVKDEDLSLFNFNIETDNEGRTLLAVYHKGVGPEGCIR